MPGVPVRIRPGTPADASALRAIEWSAGQRFRQVGLAEVADGEPRSLEELGEFAVAGRCWVAIDAAGAAIGYVITEVVDGCGHIEQVSVTPAQQGQGVGRALVEQTCAWAANLGLAAVTLTTFRGVSWNGPLYRHLGFRELAATELGPGLLAVRQAETDMGLDAAERICMRRDLPGGPA
jgi:GNAT superfamily N-acetyltransferase